MLQTLRIKNFALIEDQTIDFKKGFNVLVGETGAGKSLVLDALNFVMGEKSNKLNLRHGKDKMFVQAVFDQCDDACSLLQDNGVMIDEDIIISRMFTIDGKSECRVNGSIVPVAIVKELASHLLDVCAQNENIELLKVKNHLQILDSYAGDEVLSLKQSIADLLAKYIQIEKAMQNLGGDNSNRERELELLEYQINDIQNANLVEGEEEDIKQQINLLSNYERIVENLNLSDQALNDAVLQVQHAVSFLGVAGRFDETFLSLEQRLQSVKIEMADIDDTIVGFMQSSDYDPKRLESLEARLEVISLIKKKYGNTVADVFSYLNQIKEKRDDLLFGEERLQKLAKEHFELKEQLYSMSSKLSAIRKDIAKKLQASIEEELKMLGFKHAQFVVNFAPMPNVDQACFTRNGLDELEFVFSANAGQELKSLTKTISGGEMSRFMLAIKCVLANNYGSSTLVFDEVDTGISGEVGQKVAERMAFLAKKYQLICITHLCQVTAMADNFIYVSKEVVQGDTFTSVKLLTENEVIKQIAIISGAQPTGVALEFAQELRQKALNFKND